MPELKTRADFIKALPKKFPNIHKLYKLRDCTKGNKKVIKLFYFDRGNMQVQKNAPRRTTSTTTEGFDASIFENNPAFVTPLNMKNMGRKSSKSASAPASRTNSNIHQTIELECGNNRTREITPEELKEITGMNIDELNEINRKQQEEQATRQMQQIIVDEMNVFVKWNLCTQAIEASIKLQNSAQELKNTARLGEHKEYADL